MKKLTILRVLALLCLKKLKAYLLITLLLCLFNGQLIAQETKKPNSNTKKKNSISFGDSRSGALKIGDRLPSSFWTTKLTVLNVDKTQQQTLKHLKGKALLLDFWATWCGACLNQFPKMNQLQAQFGKHLTVLLVNISTQDNQEILGAVIKRQQSPFNPAVIAHDPTITAMFPIKSIPHYIWLGADGRIKAITDADAVTAEQLKRLIAGLEINLKTKENK